MRRKSTESGMPIVTYIGAACMVLVLVVSAVFTAGYEIFSEHVRQSNLAYTAQVFTQLEDQLQAQLQTLEDSLKGLAINRTMAAFFKGKFQELPFDSRRELDSLTMDVMLVNPDIRQIVVEGYNGITYYAADHNQVLSDAIQKLPEQPQFYYDLSPGLTIGKENKRCFLLSTSMYDIWNYTSSFFLGRMTMVVQLETLGLENFTDQYDMSLFLLNENGICASNREPTEMEQQILARADIFEDGQREIIVNGRSYLVHTGHIKALNSSLVSILPKENIMQELDQIRKSDICLMAGAVILMITVMFWLNRKINEPLYQLISHMQRIEHEEKRYFGNELHLSGYREIRQVSEEFNHMIRKFGDLTDDLVQTTTNLYEAQLQKKQAELLQLRSQINPHFLYNTLESLIGMAYLENADQTADMVKSLAQIFKYSVKGQDFVLVREEIAVTRAYLSIQQRRFPGVFEVHFCVDDDAVSCQMPKMLLQPLVENAVSHGFREQFAGTGGQLTVGVRREDKKLHLWVEDNGKGLNAEKMSYFNEMLCGDTMPSPDSIGLENVIGRIRLIYGGAGVFHMTGELGHGVRIDMELPLTYGGEKHV